ncbi:MAG: class I SAM-dependent methyltransferase [Actinomycetota bacterium]
MTTDGDDATTDSTSTAGLNAATPRPLGQAMSLAGDRTKLAEYYAAWASTYDADVGDEDYGLPHSVLVTLEAAAEAEPWLGDREIRILDAGCGTGRVAMTLAGRGYSTIDGVDLSPEMVDIARGRTRTDGSPVYRSLEGDIDLTQTPSESRNRAADLVVIGGVFTVGHIPPESLWTVADLVRPGGAMIITVRPGYYDTTDFAAVNDAFINSDRADLIVSFPSLPYTADSDGRYYAYRVH